MTDRHERGQLSLSLIEAAVGVVFVLTVAATFGLALPDPGTTEAQLDAYADDTATIVADEFHDHRDGTAMDDRIDRLLPDNLLYRVTTPAGTVGFEPPVGQTTGRAVLVIPDGEIVVEVWYV